MRETRSRLEVRLGYFATVKPLVKLVWRASPLLFVGLLALTLVDGLIPLTEILITSALLDTLVKAIQVPQPPTALPDNFILLLVPLGGVKLLGKLKLLKESLQNLYQTRVTNYTQLLITKKAASLDLAFFENPIFHERLTNASNEASYRPLMIVSQLMIVASTLTTLVSVTAVLLLWQAWIVLVLFLASLMMFWVSTRFGTAHVKLVVGRTATQRKAQYLNILLTADWVAKEIRLFGLCDFLLSKFRRLLDTMYQQDRQLASRQMLYSSPMEIVSSVVQIILVAFTAFQALRKVISIGQFNLYVQLIGQVESNLNILMLTLAQLHENNLFVANLYHFLALQPEVEAPRPDTTPFFAGSLSTPHIEFRDVSFCYPDTDKMVIKNLSFHVRPGEKIALVGENGSGKTTLVKLLAGLYEPTAGQILFNDMDINTLDRRNLRAYLSVIFQDYYIYHFSMHDNIGIGRVDQLHDRTRIEAAAKRSGLAHIIEKLPLGYDTVLGRFLELGHELSGGQRQLVAIARALMRNAPILVLDEPSAALDIYKEQRFFQRLLDKERVRDNQTVIFISHRFTTVRRADRILVMENGKLIEQGAHDELMARQGKYAEMFNLQIRMYHAPK